MSFVAGVFSTQPHLEIAELRTWKEPEDKAYRPAIISR